MTNETIIMHNDSGDGVPVRATDNGDGTYSLSVDAELTAESVTISGSVALTPGTYLGQQVLSYTSSTNQNATLPTGTKGIWIAAENNPAYAAINTTAAPTTAGIYIPKDTLRYAGPYDGITSFGVYAASGVYVHLVYEA